MVAIIPGTRAPQVLLSTTTGSALNLADALSQHKYVVLAFFKVSCPVCQFTFPYLERLKRLHPSIPIWGVSQDDSDATTAFARMYGLTFPLLLDTRLDLTVAYGLTNVPTTFLVAADGSIQQTIVGWVKSELEELNTRLSEISETAGKPLFTAADEVPELRPG